MKAGRVVWLFARYPFLEPDLEIEKVLSIWFCKCKHCIECVSAIVNREEIEIFGRARRNSEAYIQRKTAFHDPSKRIRREKTIQDAIENNFLSYLSRARWSGDWLRRRSSRAVRIAVADAYFMR